MTEREYKHPVAFGLSLLVTLAIMAAFEYGSTTLPHPGDRIGMAVISPFLAVFFEVFLFMPVFDGIAEWREQRVARGNTR